VGVIGEDFR